MASCDGVGGILIFALCFIPRKPKFDNDDDLSDLI